MTALLTTQLPFPVRHGKVRDVYDLGEQLLIVATDRISAFDVIMEQGIPGKGRILTQVANFWFEATRDILPNHLLATQVAGLPGQPAALRRSSCEGRAILVRTHPGRAHRMRGAGLSGRFRTEGIPGLRHGLRHPAARRDCAWRIGSRSPSSRLPPRPRWVTTRTSTSSRMADHRGTGAGAPVEGPQPGPLPARRGAGRRSGGSSWRIPSSSSACWRMEHLILIDEALTPDSSRYWLADSWRPGGEPAEPRQAVPSRLPGDPPGLEQAGAGSAPARAHHPGGPGALPGPGATFRHPDQLTVSTGPRPAFTSPRASWEPPPPTK